MRDTWASLVVPHLELFITLLIVAEATAGALILSGGRRTHAGLMMLIGFHVGQLAFGGVLWGWAPIMLVTLTLLLRAERQASYAAAVGARRSDRGVRRSESPQDPDPLQEPVRDRRAPTTLAD